MPALWLLTSVRHLDPSSRRSRHSAAGISAPWAAAAEGGAAGLTVLGPSEGGSVGRGAYENRKNRLSLFRLAKLGDPAARRAAEEPEGVKSQEKEE